MSHNQRAHTGAEGSASDEAAVEADLTFGAPACSEASTIVNGEL